MKTAYEYAHRYPNMPSLVATDRTKQGAERKKSIPLFQHLFVVLKETAFKRLMDIGTGGSWHTLK
jgi:hypothetical protein